MSGRLFPLLFLFMFFPVGLSAQGGRAMANGALWPDASGRHINAHGGGLLWHRGRYYWFGEDKDARTNAALTGVSCYVSRDLLKWTKCPFPALSVDTVDAASPIARGCTLERPKVIYNRRTRRFVMWFHLELPGMGYAAAYAGVAVSRRPEGPYTFLGAHRVNAGRWPLGMDSAARQRADTLRVANYREWWTPAWREAVHAGLFLRRDLVGGQMARDQQLFVDTDGTAYHIYSSEENLTLHIAELTPDYLSHTGRYVRVAPGDQNEAPCLFRASGWYWLVTSGCTGWEPNAARLYRARSIWGPWEGDLGNPCRGGTAQRPAGKTFLGQGTQVFPLPNGRFLFLADEWHPQEPSDGRYLWLPVTFGAGGLPEIHWRGRWDD